MSLDDTVRELTVCRANSSRTLPERTLEEINTARVYRRFYAAFHLRDLCNELPIHAVARKYETPRGFVQNLAQTCEGFAAGMVKFCDRMGMGMLRSVLEHMIDRLKAGAKADLLELAKIPFVKSRTARVFWENGMRSLRAVAEASPTDIVAILLLVSDHAVLHLSCHANSCIGSAQEIKDQWGGRGEVSPKAHAQGGDYCFCRQSIMG